jgi:hypothetical protein
VGEIIHRVLWQQSHTVISNLSESWYAGTEAATIRRETLKDIGTRSVHTSVALKPIAKAVVVADTFRTRVAKHGLGDRDFEPNDSERDLCKSILCNASPRGEG